MPDNADSAAPETFSILRNAGTAAISDTFDAMGLKPPVLDNALKPVAPFAPFAAPAYTISGAPQTYTGSDHDKLAAIDAIHEGQVAVWASQDAQGVCCFGDLLATAMRARGCIAAVVDGGVRDVAFLEGCGMPVIARYRTPAQGVGRWRVTASQTTIKVRGALADWVAISPGDVIAGDADGIIVVPVALVSEVTSRVASIPGAETAARAEIAGGLPLLDALKKYGHL